MRPTDDRLVLGCHRRNAVHLLEVEARVDGGAHPAHRAASHELFGEPQISLLVAQRHMGSADWNHARRTERLANGHLNLHRQLSALAVLPVKHCKFLIG